MTADLDPQTPVQQNPVQQDPTREDPIRVDMIADLACPWCYIGLARLEAAAASRPGVTLDLRWWPFLLNPQLPPDGMDRQTYLRAKFGSDSQAAQIYARIEAAGHDAGIPFAFEAMPRTPNTVQAQRLVLIAQERRQTMPDQPHRLIRRLFEALFEEGQDIGRRDTLKALALAAGLEQATIDELFAGTAYNADVLHGHQRAEMMGVRGVPVYIVAGEHVISGAQPAEVLAGLFDLARMPLPA
jgi:predicted DsbA family dithiol-disulfide isomerase